MSSIKTFLVNLIQILISFLFFSYIFRQLSNEKQKSPNIKHVASFGHSNSLPSSVAREHPLIVHQKILCAILTNPANYNDRIRDVLETWGSKCDKIVFITSASNNTLRSMIRKRRLDKRKNLKGKIDLFITPYLPTEDRQYLWLKLHSGLEYIYSKYLNQYKWFYRADDDVYVIFENLRYSLYTLNYSQVHFKGFRFFNPYNRQQTYLAGSSVIMSREALRQLIENGFRKNITQCQISDCPDDVCLGECFTAIGIIAADLLDSSGISKIFPLQSSMLLSSQLADLPDWYPEYCFLNVTYGMNCCSSEPISFHYEGDPFQRQEIDFCFTN